MKAKGRAVARNICRTAVTDPAHCVLASSPVPGIKINARQGGGVADIDANSQRSASPLGDDRRRCVGRREDRVPGVAFEALQALLLQCRQIGQRPHTRRHSRADRTYRAGLGLRQRDPVCRSNSRMVEIQACPAEESSQSPIRGAPPRAARRYGASPCTRDAQPHRGTAAAAASLILSTPQNLRARVQQTDRELGMLDLAATCNVADTGIVRGSGKDIAIKERNCPLC
jgi:hypothetical protein